MKVHLKRAAHLGGHDYKIGVHEIPDELVKHWFFLALHNNGDVAIVSGPKEETPVEVAAKEELAVEAAPKEIYSELKKEEEIPKGSKKKKRG